MFTKPMNKKLFFSLLAILSIVSVSLVGAQSQSNVNTISSSLPHLYISNISLGVGDSYKTGDTISGSFDVQNSDVNDTPDLNYIISLVGLDQSGRVARLIYDSQTKGPISISSNSTKTIPFSYKLKSAPEAGNLAIHIRVIMKDGTSLAWQLTPIKISGGEAMLDVASAYVTLNGRQYGLQEGPTVKPDEKISFLGTYLNKSSADISLTPITTFFDKTNQPVAGMVAEKGSSLTFLHNASTTVTINLPVATMKAGVYLAKTSLVDSKGNTRAPDLYARYIIGVDIINIQSVYSNTSFPLTKNQNITLSVGYTGDPLDITKFREVVSTSTTSGGASTSTTKLENIASSSTPVIADLQIKLLNQDGKTVASTTLKDQTFLLAGFMSVPITLSGDASSSLAQINILKNGNIIAQYYGNIVYDAGKQITSPVVATSQNIFIPIIILVIILIAIIILVLYFVKKKRSPEAVELLLLVVILSTFILAGVHVVRAQYVMTGYNDVGNFAGQRQIFITGGPPSSVTTGQTFSVNVTVMTVACTNSYGYADVTASFNGKGYDSGQVTVNNATNPGVTSIYNPYADFYLGVYTAPSTAGVSNFYTNVHSYWYIPDEWYNYRCFSPGGDFSYDEYYCSTYDDGSSCNFIYHVCHDAAYTDDIGYLYGYWPVTTIASSCTGPDGSSIANGASKTYYNATSSSACVNIVQTRTCNNGTLSGDSTYQYGSCGNSCSGPDGSIILNAGNKTYYNATSSANCVSSSQSRVCTNGTLSGTYTNVSCSSPAVPSTPILNVTTSPTCGGGINLSWNTISGASGYYIYKSSTSNGAYSRLFTVTSATSISDMSGSGYYKMTSFNSVGVESATSTLSQGTASRACLPASVSLAPLKTPININSSCTVNWSITNATSTCSLIGTNINGVGNNSYTFSIPSSGSSNGSKATGSLNSSASYTLSCVGLDDKPVSISATCSITPKIIEN